MNVNRDIMIVMNDDRRGRQDGGITTVIDGGIMTVQKGHHNCRCRRHRRRTLSTRATDPTSWSELLDDGGSHAASPRWNGCRDRGGKPCRQNKVLFLTVRHSRNESARNLGASGVRSLHLLPS
jgi:hypothetical protein